MKLGRLLVALSLIQPGYCGGGPVARTVSLQSDYFTQAVNVPLYAARHYWGDHSLRHTVVTMALLGVLGAGAAGQPVYCPPDDEKRIAYIRSLHRISSPDRWKLVTKDLIAGSIRVRLEAARIIDEAEAPESSAMLLERSREENDSPLQYIVTTLTKIHGTDFIRKLIADILRDKPYKPELFGSRYPEWRAHQLMDLLGLTVFEDLLGQELGRRYYESKIKKDERRMMILAERYEKLQPLAQEEFNNELTRLESVNYLTKYWILYLLLGGGLAARRIYKNFVRRSA